MTIAAANYDVVVLDAWFDVDQPLSRSDVEFLKSKPGGKKRVVLAYLSIGEAEDDRSNWDPSWDEHPPAWLGDKNPNWPGSRAVRSWDPEWRTIVAVRVGGLVDAGFDGIYLDKVDAHAAFESP
jgi:cysteinyl-tRNA synthetase, unknown class